MPVGDEKHILMVDDEPEICRMVSGYLTEEGYRVSTATNGARMREVLAKSAVHLVILDLGLQGEDGLELARALRAESDIGIIMLTGRGELADRVAGLEIGADDYLTKPVALRELLARVRSVLRRHRSGGAGPGVRSPSTARFAGWSLDFNARELTAADGGTVPLTTAEFRLLTAFVTSPQQALDRNHLLGLVAEREWSPYDRSVDVLIGKLRQKIEPDPKKPSLIKTERGIGYILSVPVELS
ncbi:MAG: response regulator transcription factor [Proteobacteria bacterium]|nr:response regulator transcription factor [Pseudomonadota bacterium]